LAKTLMDFKFFPSKADPDVWMRPAVKADGTPVYEYVLCYVDDILGIMVKPDEFIANLKSVYTFKDGSIGEPKQYLGAVISKHYIPDADDPGKVRWAMSSDKYVKSAIAEVEVELNKIGKLLPTKVSTPMQPNYRPEVDASPVLDSRRALYYQGLIGVLRWICELGCIDIITDCSLLASQMAQPREGHLNQVFHIFAYLKRYDRSKMVFDDTDPAFDSGRFTKCDWAEYYPGATEAIPPNVPQPRGKSVSINCFVDAAHAGCRLTRRSQTGVLIFCNRAPIMWLSKKQNTVESSTFGSEFAAMRTALEMIEGL
jgi:hypothetical protein